MLCFSSDVFFLDCSQCFVYVGQFYSGLVMSMEVQFSCNFPTHVSVRNSAQSEQKACRTDVITANDKVQIPRVGGVECKKKKKDHYLYGRCNENGTIKPEYSSGLCLVLTW